MSVQENLAEAASASCESRLAIEQLSHIEPPNIRSEVATHFADAVCGELRALRLTLAAALAPEIAERRPSRWVRLELFGHSVRYGLLSEVESGGRTFFELLEPSICDENEVVRESSGKLYHPNAVYALEETPYETVVAVLSREAGLYRWPDGSWRKVRPEPVAVALDPEALRDRAADTAGRTAPRCDPDAGTHYHGAGDVCECGQVLNTRVVPGPVDRSPRPEPDGGRFHG